MLTRKTALAALVMAGAVWGGSAQIAQAQKSCNLMTAKLSLEPARLCECKIVTTQMLRYIQRQDEFLTVLAGVTEQCPAFADALNALPTATVVARPSHRDKDDDTLDVLPAPGPGDGPKKPGGGGGDGPGGGDNPDPGGPGDNPDPTGDGDGPGDNPDPTGDGDGPGDNPDPGGCTGGGGSSDPVKTQARVRVPDGCDS